MEALSISQAPNNRNSFILQQPSQRASTSNNAVDRKPEELDALANELLSEFILKKNDHQPRPQAGTSVGASNTDPNSLSAIQAPAISLSPLSSSGSSSTGSSRSSTGSSSSRSDSDSEKEAPIQGLDEDGDLEDDDLMMITNDRSSSNTTINNNNNNNNQHDSTVLIHENAGGGSAASNNVVSVSNKSGTFIRRESSSGCGSSVTSSDSSNSVQQKPQLQQQQQQPQAFVSYNPNSKTAINNGLELNNVIITTNNSGMLAGLGAASSVQPLNEQQIRKSMQLAQNVSYNLLVRVQTLILRWKMIQVEFEQLFVKYDLLILIFFAFFRK